MSSDVTANSRTVVHKGDGIVNVSALPDVCKTPTPAGPTPVPYPNVARSSDLADGAKHVTIEGNPVALENSKLSQSSGDEAGTLGGVVSGKNRGKMTWGTSSPDVCVEGKGVIRFADLTHHNCNSYNTIHGNGGQPYVIVVYGDDAPCPICGKEPPDHPYLTDEKALPKLQSLLSKLGDPKEEEAMLAVVTCAKCTTVFAAISRGPDNPLYDRFFGACKDLCYVSEVRPSTIASALNNMLRKNIQKNWLRQNPGRKLLWKSKRLSQKLENVRNRIRDSVAKSNAIAQCAGPRALTLSITQGHQPSSLCEIWYGHKRPRPQTVQRDFSSREQFEAALFASHNIVKTKMDATHHVKQVASCETCTRQIPALLCREMAPRCAKL